MRHRPSATVRRPRRPRSDPPRPPRPPPPQPPGRAASPPPASPHPPAHVPCSPRAYSYYTPGRLRAWDLCAPCRRLLHGGADFPARTPPVREERSALRMAKIRSEPRRPSTPTAFEQARDELFSHILRCGVLEASAEHQQEWFDDTMLYLADRYEELDEPQLAELRVLGERYCRPVMGRNATVGAGA